MAECDMRSVSRGGGVVVVVPLLFSFSLTYLPHVTASSLGKDPQVLRTSCSSFPTESVFLSTHRPSSSSVDGSSLRSSSLFPPWLNLPRVVRYFRTALMFNVEDKVGRNEWIISTARGNRHGYVCVASSTAVWLQKTKPPGDENSRRRVQTHVPYKYLF